MLVSSFKFTSLNLSRNRRTSFTCSTWTLCLLSAFTAFVSLNQVHSGVNLESTWHSTMTVLFFTIFTTFGFSLITGITKTGEYSNWILFEVVLKKEIRETHFQRWALDWHSIRQERSWCYTCINLNLRHLDRSTSIWCNRYPASLERYWSRSWRTPSLSFPHGSTRFQVSD